MDHWNVVNLNSVCAVVTPTGDFLLVPSGVARVGLTINTVGVDRTRLVANAPAHFRSHA